MSQFGLSVFETSSAFATGNKTIKQNWSILLRLLRDCPLLQEHRLKEFSKDSGVGRQGGARGRLGRTCFNLKGMAEGQGHRLLSYRNRTLWGQHAFSFLFQENPDIFAFCKYWAIKYWALHRWSNLFPTLTLSSYWATCGGGVYITQPVGEATHSALWWAPIALMCTISLCCKYVLKQKSFLLFVSGTERWWIYGDKTARNEERVGFSQVHWGPKHETPWGRVPRRSRSIQLNENEVVHGGMWVGELNLHMLIIQSMGGIAVNMGVLVVFMASWFQLFGGYVQMLNRCR